MRACVVFLVVAVVSGGMAKPPGLILGYQDTLGQYSFGYSAPDSARSEVRALDGTTRGSYSYIDGAGVIQSADYTADGDNGFRVAATNLPQAPVPVQETPEVAAARVAHLEALQKAGASLANSDNAGIVVENVENQPIVKSVENERPAESAPEVTQGNLQEAVAEKSDVPAESRSAEQAPDTVEIQSATNSEAVNEDSINRSAEPNEKPSIIQSVATPLLIPVNLNVQPLGAIEVTGLGKAGEIPQASLSQDGNNAITPAGTVLKASNQQSPIEQKSVPVESAESAIIPAGYNQIQFQQQRAVYSPYILPLGYSSAIGSIQPIVRYTPIPYVTYNLL
ncbi:uncharacterized protein LOC107266225 [Cephus cinctus]|uniref:Uncharacterized protein LOC107266225 n=1 Tax=Cephus cinctus TaxID=211228 RepID=A0AAJ7BQL9_CEPCN|nr:uncharacterized protein LOC107266225 [Cephus cinctus]